MKTKLFKVFSLVMILAMLLPATALGQEPTSSVEQPALTSDGGSKWYVVEFEDPSLVNFAKSVSSGETNLFFDQGKLNVNSVGSKNYIESLKTEQAKFSATLVQDFPGTTVGRSFQIALNALAVQLPDSSKETVKALMAMPGVTRVTPQQIYTVNMDYSNPLINADAIWSQLGGQDAAGAGIKVAVVDSGIDPDHALFDGTGWSYPSTGTWPKGYCETVAGFCNGKIISARYYAPSFPVNVNEVLSPQDIDGHGTHTAGTSAGNRTTATYGSTTTEISGVAPGAWVMAYKALFHTVDGTSASGSNIMLAGAVEDAIADGADVINNSWGGATFVLPENDVLTTAYSAAVDAGVVVVFSAGNSGDEYNTIGSPTSPKFIEVGASTTERAFYNEVSVTAPEPVTDTLQAFAGNEFHDLDPASIPDDDIGPLPYIPTDLLGNPDTTLPGVTVGITQTEPYSSDGWIALIPRGAYNFTVKLDNAIRHGASAVVMYTDAARTWKGGFTATGRNIYTVMIANDIGLEARDWWVTYTDTARIQIGYPFQEFVIETPDVIADFSSRGPNIDLDIKPDITAPGVNILSGAPDGGYASYGGTSMAAPHVAGAAALLLQLHPDWTPAQVKSALMSTASQTILDLDEVTPADVMTQGSGRLDLTDAGDPGLTFDHPSHSFGMVSYGSSESVQITASDVSGMAEVYDLSVVETVTDTGYVTVTVSPTTMNMSADGTSTFTLTVEVAPMALQQDLEGNIVISGTEHVAHIPYWVRVVPGTASEVLLVDMDIDGFFGVDYQGYYTNTLESLGVTYDVWDMWYMPYPDRSVLDQYDKVIVFFGDNYMFWMDPIAEDIRNYLAAGGKMLVTGQDAVGNDGLRPFMRGAADVPLSDTVYGPYYTPPTQPSGIGVSEYNPFLKDFVFDMSFAGDGAWNQLYVDEVDWINYSDLDTKPLFQVPNIITGTVENGYIATRSSYEPTLEREDDHLSYEPLSWRVVYLGFGLEGVNNDTGFATREDLLSAIFAWFDDEVTVSFDQASYFSPRPFAFVTFDATMVSTESADAVYYRWDFGDGSDIELTTDPTVEHQYQEMGFYNARVEVMDEYGHKIVSEPVQVQVGTYLYLPLVTK